MTTLAIDVGGSSFKIALVEHGAILAQTRIPHTSIAGDLDLLAERCARLVDETPGAALRAVGMSLPGVTQQETGSMVSAHEKCDFLLSMDVRSWLERTFRVPAVVENDGRAAMWGEVGAGVAAGERDAVVLTFGTGIGVGALVGGRALHGAHEHGAILGGHQQIDPFGGRICTCGARGCLEAIAGGWSMPSVVREWPGVADSALGASAEAGFDTVADAARAGDVVARAICDFAARVWAVGIVNLCHVLDPRVVVLTGGLMSSADLVIDRIRSEVDARLWAVWGRPRILVADDVYASATLGIAHLAERAAHARSDHDTGAAR